MSAPVCPPLAADVIAEVGDRVVLIERKNFPPGWAIPGGSVEFGAPVERAAIREAWEETSLEVELRALLGVYSRPNNARNSASSEVSSHASRIAARSTLNYARCWASIRGRTATRAATRVI